MRQIHSIISITQPSMSSSRLRAPRSPRQDICHARVYWSTRSSHFVAGSLTSSSVLSSSSSPTQMRTHTGRSITVSGLFVRSSLLYHSQSISGSASHLHMQLRRNISSSAIIRDSPSLNVPLEQPPQTPDPPYIRWISYLPNIGAILSLMTLFSLLPASGTGTSDTFSDWPEELRKDLQSAVRAKNAKNYELSESHFLRAYLTAKIMPLEKLGSEPYMTLSAIAIALGEIRELRNDLENAFNAYFDVFRVLVAIEDKKMNREVDEQVDLRTLTGSGSSDDVFTHAENSQKLSIQGRHRLIALAIRLNELAETVHPAIFEKSSFLLRLWPSSMRVALTEAKNKEEDSDSTQQASELSLPNWARTPNLLVPLRAHVKALFKNKSFISALELNSLMVMYLSKRMFNEDIMLSCQACEVAEILNESADFILNSFLISKETKLNAAESSLSQAKNLAISFLKSRGFDYDRPCSSCEQVLPAILVNLGNVQEMRGELEDAQSNFSIALAGAKALGQHEDAEKAQEGLARVIQLKVEEKPKEIESNAMESGDK